MSGVAPFFIRSVFLQVHSWTSGTLLSICHHLLCELKSLWSSLILYFCRCSFSNLFMIPFDVKFLQSGRQQELVLCTDILGLVLSPPAALASPSGWSWCLLFRAWSFVKSATVAKGSFIGWVGFVLLWCCHLKRYTARGLIKCILLISSSRGVLWGMDGVFHNNLFLAAFFFAVLGVDGWI